ncbi:MAG: WG repeat-containing protein [Prevotella sp.]
MNKLLKCIGILCGTVAMQYGFTSCSSNSDTETIDLLPVQVTSEGRWSMIDKKGNIVYDSEFENTPTMVINGFFSVKENDGYTLYKAGSKSPEPVEGCENLNAVGIMEDGLVPLVRPEKRIEIVNESGETQFELTPIDSVEVVSCEEKFSDGLLAIMTSDYKHGFVDEKGKLVIPCIYDYSLGFENGYAIVSKRNVEGAGTETYYVIDTSGDEVFKIEESTYTPVFFHGYVMTVTDGHYNLIDMDGDVHELPSKVNGLKDMKGDLIIYTDESGYYGLVNLDGDVIIRAKYYDMNFAFNGDLIVKQESDSHEVLILDNEGDEKKTLDIDDIRVVSGFGYLGLEGHSFIVLDEDFKEVGKDEFRTRSDYRYSGDIQSYYVNYDLVAGTFVRPILDDGSGIKDYEFGKTAESLLPDESPREYAYATEYHFKVEDICMIYRVQSKLYVTERMADSGFQNDTFQYTWNPDSKLCMLKLTLESPKDWGMSGHTALLGALKKKGFSIVKEGMVVPTYGFTHTYAFGTIMKKGNLIAVVMDSDKWSEVTLMPSNFFTNVEESAKNIIFGKYAAGQDGSVNQAEAASMEPNGIDNFEAFKTQQFIELHNK